MTASTSGDSMRSSADGKAFAPGTPEAAASARLGSISATARISAPRNRFRNRLDVIGSHDSSADNSYAKSVVFGHVLQ